MSFDYKSVLNPGEEYRRFEIWEGIQCGKAWRFSLFYRAAGDSFDQVLESANYESRKAMRPYVIIGYVPGRYSTLKEHTLAIISRTKSGQLAARAEYGKELL